MSQSNNLPPWEGYHRQIDDWLAGCLPERAPARLRQAMAYSLLAGGKRLRPMLAMEFCRVCGGPAETALPVGCAVELLHT